MAECVLRPGVHISPRLSSHFASEVAYEPPGRHPSRCRWAGAPREALRQARLLCQGALGDCPLGAHGVRYACCCCCCCVVRELPSGRLPVLQSPCGHVVALIRSCMCHHIYAARSADGVGDAPAPAQRVGGGSGDASAQQSGPGWAREGRGRHCCRCVAVGGVEHCCRCPLGGGLRAEPLRQLPRAQVSAAEIAN